MQHTLQIPSFSNETTQIEHFQEGSTKTNLLPTIEELAKKILDFQQELLKKNNRPIFSEKQVTEKTKLYCQIEEEIRKDEQKIPTWDQIGPLHYGMTLEKMKQVVIEKFKSMVDSGTIIRKTTKEKKFDQTALFLTRDRTNLTRIWGAEFLKKNLPKEGSLNVVDHYIIVDDDARELEVTIFHDDYPYVSKIKNGGQIFSTKIEGEKNASAFASSDVLKNLFYSDFSDEGNILCDSSHTNWIVDTERKSFDAPELDDIAFQIREYVKLRFRFLAHDEYLPNFQPITISLSEIGI